MSTSRRLLITMLSLGLVIGLIFPPFASIFVLPKPGMTHWFWIACILAGLGMGIACFAIMKMVVFSELRRIGAFIRAIATSTGDLSRRVPARATVDDELDELVKWVNEMAGALSQNVTDLAAEIAPVLELANRLDGVTVRLSTTADALSAKVSAVGVASSDTSGNVGTIAAAANDLKSFIQTVAVTVEEISASVQEISRTCREELTAADTAGGHAHNALECMTQLDQSSRSIATVSKLISDIADNTNLLALNATIEAASAGEAGKGFAVVATEVKTLSKQTAGATGEIEKSLSRLQEQAGQARTILEKISATVTQVDNMSQSIAAAVQQQSGAISEIARSVSTSTAAAGKVSASVESAAASIQEIAVNIRSVGEAARETAQESTQVKQASRQLTEAARRLETLMTKFGLKKRTGSQGN